MKNDFEVLTLAIPKDYKKAIAMSLSLKEHSPNVPISIVCPESIKNEVEPYFQYVIIERSDLKGFEHKLFLDEYSPYEKTLFIDADMLIFKDIVSAIEEWKGNAYAAVGRLITGDISTFGLDRADVLTRHRKEKFSSIDGAGHAYFEKPQCKDVFDLARSILSGYDTYTYNKFADEDGMGIALTILGIEPKENHSFLGSPCYAQQHSFKINTNKWECNYTDKLTGYTEPVIVHFPCFTYPMTYAREIMKTYKRNRVKINGVYSTALKEILTTSIIWPLNTLRKKLFFNKENP